jgi:hypothetical protein
MLSRKARTDQPLYCKTPEAWPDRSFPSGATMRTLFCIGALALTVAGCASDPTAETQRNVYGGYDDISGLECTGRWLNKVAECELQRARENLGSGEPVTLECKQVLFIWDRGWYATKCQGLHERSDASQRGGQVPLSPIYQYRN